VEAEVLVKSLFLDLFSFVKIDDLPSLVFTILSSMDNNFATFLIFLSFNMKLLLVLPVDELFIFIGEDLPPLRVGASKVHTLVCSIALDVP
jgi:hypothetical protein